MSQPKNQNRTFHLLRKADILTCYEQRRELLDHLSETPTILSSGFPDNAAFPRTNPQVGSKLRSDQCIGLISPNCGSVLAAIRVKWWETASRGLAEPLFSVGVLQKQSVVIPCAGPNV